MVRMPVTTTPTSGPAEESQFLSDVCTSLTEALRVAHCPSVTFCWLHAIIKVSQSHTWWRSVQELGRCIVIATSDCRCKKSKRRGVKVPFHLCLCSLSLTPIERSSLTSSFQVASILQVRTPQGLVEHPAETVKSLEVRKSRIFFSEFTSLLESPLSLHYNPGPPA